jgi:hypothetical protein
MITDPSFIGYCTNIIWNFYRLLHQFSVGYLHITIEGRIMFSFFSYNHYIN